jgi:hypothetical protein
MTSAVRIRLEPARRDEGGTGLVRATGAGGRSGVAPFWLELPRKGSGSGMTSAAPFWRELPRKAGAGS